MSKLSDNLKKIRKEKGYTQKQLANLLNVSQNAVYNWENQKCDPDIDTLERLSDILEVDMNHLFGVRSSGTFIFCEYPDFSEENPNETKLISAFHALNDKGQEKAIEHIELLTKVPEYQKDSD